MAQHLWFFYALGAALMWGIGYTLSEKVLKEISPSFYLFLQVLLCIPFYLAISYFGGTFKSSFDALINDQKLLIFCLIVAMTFVFGNFFIFASIAQKNATLSNMIEMSYPVFTILFTWLIFREFHLSISTLIGSVLIMSGAFLIVWKS